MSINLDDLPEHIRRLNPHLYHGGLQAPVAQPTVLNEPLAKAAGETPRTSRFRVSITSRRKRLIDPDNICVKHLLDCCRYAQFIPNDTAQDIDLVVRQEKAKEDSTVIVIERI